MFPPLALRYQGGGRTRGAEPRQIAAAEPIRCHFHGQHHAEYDR